MKILFTRNNTWGSRFIRWVTGEEISHVAVSFDDITYHSTMMKAGMNLVWTDTFLEKNIVVDSVYWYDDRALLSRLRGISTEGYDWILLLTMGLRILGLPIRVVDNPYRDSCTEVVTEQILGIKDKLTPGQLLSKLKEHVK